MPNRVHLSCQDPILGGAVWFVPCAFCMENNRWLTVLQSLDKLKVDMDRGTRENIPIALTEYVVIKGLEMRCFTFLHNIFSTAPDPGTIDAAQFIRHLTHFYLPLIVCYVILLNNMTGVGGLRYIT